VSRYFFYFYVRVEKKVAEPEFFNESRLNYLLCAGLWRGFRSAGAVCFYERKYTQEFKKEAVKLITVQGYQIPEVSVRVFDNGEISVRKYNNRLSYVGP
jgi:hypothetical protein